jgi:hypothetical protein
MKHIHLGFYTGNEGFGCSSKVLLMMGNVLNKQTTARNTSTLASIWKPESAAEVQKCS